MLASNPMYFRAFLNSSFLSLSPAGGRKVIRGFEGLDVGDRVRVELIGTDVERGFIDFARAG